MIAGKQVDEYMKRECAPELSEEERLFKKFSYIDGCKETQAINQNEIENLTFERDYFRREFFKAARLLDAMNK